MCGLGLGMIERKRGRPPKADRKKISIDQALELSKNFWAQYGKPGYSKQHIYNLIHRKELSKEKHGKCVLVFEDEIIQKLCG